MAKAKASTKYKIVGKTSDGVKVLKPKMASGHLRELRSKVERLMAASRQLDASAVTMRGAPKVRAK